MINGTKVNKALEKDGTTYVSLRELAEIIGLNLTWDKDTKTVNVRGDMYQSDKSGVPSAKVTVSDQEKAMLKVIDDNKTQIIDISKKIWELKEPSTQEFKSAALLEDALEKHGFTVTRGLKGIDPFDNKECDIPTAFIATYEKIPGGPTIGIMLEYDALSMGHACGHNLISASGFAAALALKDALATTPGKLVVLGTPAEEWGGPGKTQMIKGGHFEGIDAVLITHPGDKWNTESEVLAIGWPRGEVMTFKGVAAHASADPEKGVSALDAAMLFGFGVDMLREHIIDGSRIHYCIMDGGQAPNVVPDNVKMDIYVRAKDTAYLYELMDKVDKIAQGAALATGATVEYEWDYPWLAGVPVPTFYDFVKNVGVALGIPESEFKKETALGSSDFGNVAYEIPTVNLYFPIAPPGTPGHSEAFMNAAVSDYGHESMLQAAKMVALSGYKLLTDPVLLQEIKAEFAQNKTLRDAQN
jgi:aminobenzoyl-glutamate utilization protein B